MCSSDLNARRSPSPPFSVGQQVFVKAKFFCTIHPSKKLSDKYTGPFEIIAKPGTHSFTLRLPESMRGVHPVFHVSMLEPATPNEIPNRTQSLPPLINIDGEPEFEIAKVVDSKIDKQQ